MDYRANVYSPVQNMTVWLAAWLYGQVSADECSDALEELGGTQRLEGSHPEEAFGTLSVLKHIRLEASGYLNSSQAAGEPVLRLILSGPGDPARLPPLSEAARMLSEGSGAGAAVAIAQPRMAATVLVPSLDFLGTSWSTFHFDEPLPAPEYVSPGEADYLLAEATRTAAQLIDALPESSRRSDQLPNPRLTVGTLADFYETPGLPFCTPPRAAKLFARADRVAAILETVGGAARDSSLDPMLLPLWRHIRTARMAATSYSVTEFARA